MSTLTPPRQPRLDDRAADRTTRTVALAPLAVVVLTFLGGLGGPFFDHPTNSEAVAWVRSHPSSIIAQGLVSAVGMVLLALCLVHLLRASGHRGYLYVIGVGFICADTAVDWVVAGLDFALADLGRGTGNDQSVLTLFSVSKEMTFADGFLFGAAVFAYAAVALTRGCLPRALAWTTGLVGLTHLLALPVQLALTGTPEGVVGPLSVTMLLVWLVVLGLTLLLRPRAALPSVA